MNNSFATFEILNAIRKVVGKSTPDHPIALHEPYFRDTDAWLYVKDCLDTGWVSTAGKWVSLFEQELASKTGARHVIAVSNGTVALRLALHLAGVSSGDEVLVPPLSFVATTNAVSHLGAIPHFVDVDPITLAMDASALSDLLDQTAEIRNGQTFNRLTGRRIAAVLPVHVFGYPADMTELLKVSNAWLLPIVEDAAEALGSWRHETHCGLFGIVGTLSFNGNKLITTGGGGALITNDSDLGHRARHLSTTAKVPHPWDFVHDAVAWNDRLPNINAALGVAQLEDLEKRLIAKSQLSKLYEDTFSGLEGVEFFKEPPGCRSNQWLMTLRFTDNSPTLANAKRLALLHEAHSVGILLRPVWRPLHQLAMYENCPRGDLAMAEDQSQRLLNLPSSPQLLNV